MRKSQTQCFMAVLGHPQARANPKVGLVVCDPSPARQRLERFLSTQGIGCQELDSAKPFCFAAHMPFSRKEITEKLASVQRTTGAARDNMIGLGRCRPACVRCQAV